MTVRLLLVAVAIALLVGVSLVLAHRLRRQGVPPARWLVNMLFPASQLSVVCFLFYYEMAYDLPFWLLALTALAGVLCGFGDLALFKALLAAEEKDLAEERVRLLEEQLAMQARYCERLVQDRERARALREDMREELVAVSDLLRRNELQEASRQLRLASNLMEGRERVCCEHRVVDALVSLKAGACAQEGIALSLSLAVPDDIPLPSVEVCAVFSNLLDNAMNACRKVEAGQRRIGLKACAAHGCLVVDMENGCAANSDCRRRVGWRRGSGLARHGWGLAIIEGIAARHDGAVEIEMLDGVCRTTVVLKAGAS